MDKKNIHILLKIIYVYSIHSNLNNFLCDYKEFDARQLSFPSRVHQRCGAFISSGGFPCQLRPISQRDAATGCVCGAQDDMLHGNSSEQRRRGR
tara:strand:- start:5850 stop:6131 length:282 start_codon:yes stop_codon:yes gene_type:complete